MKLMYIAFAHSTHTIKWVNYFKDLGHDIMLVSFYPTDKEIEGVDIRHIEIGNKNAALLRVFQVRKLIREFQPDILHAHYASSCGVVASMTRFHPFVLSVWGDDILEFPKKSFFHRWAVKKVILNADHVTATSNMLRDATEKLIDINMEMIVIPFGVDLDKFNYFKRTGKEKIKIGTVRIFRPKYGLEYLLKAFAKLRESYNNITLTIVGDGILREKLHSLAASLSISDCVCFPGAVPNDKVAIYMRDFDIFAIPSIGQGETFGVAAVEAMATGLPVVASNVGGLPEVVDDGKTGRLVKPGDVESLKNALEYYILSGDARIEHGRRGREKVEREYNWQENAKLMAKLYENILNETK
jgi:glycosyltransferase involved in cell wall biosynthesis